MPVQGSTGQAPPHVVGIHSPVPNLQHNQADRLDDDPVFALRNGSHKFK
jgi:hypothetical protein